MFKIFRDNTEEENKNKVKKATTQNKKVVDNKSDDKKRTVKNDLVETKEIIKQLKELQKKVTSLKREGRDNPKLDKLLESISSESYKICLKC